MVFLEVAFTIYADDFIILIGRHCCLWCTIPSDKLKIDKGARNSENTVAPRSLASLSEKYQEFVTAGSNLLLQSLFQYTTFSSKFFTYVTRYEKTRLNAQTMETEIHAFLKYV